MSRILSDDEVDALLSGVRAGAVPAGGRAPGSGVQTLDLTSQERSLRGRLPGLELVVDRFVRGLRSSLGALLGQAPDLDVRGLELLRLARPHDRLVMVDERSMGADENARICRPLGTVPVLFVALRIV